MGKVSKKILSRLLTSLRKKLNLQQWINSASTIEWFKSLDDKESLTFLQFDIVEFYKNNQISSKELVEIINLYFENIYDIYSFLSPLNLSFRL